jgi:hypothetical protein
MPSFLFYDPVTPAVFRYVNASPVQVGNSFGTADGGSATDQQVSKLRNRVVQFQGQIYAMNADGIYRKDDPLVLAGDWTRVLVMTNPETTDNSFGGLYPVDIGGTSYLTGVYGGTESSVTMHWVKFDGTTWTQGSGTVTSTIISFRDAVVIKNVLHFIYGSNTSDSSASFDPSTETFSDHTELFNDATTALCVFNDTLYALHNVIADDVTLSEFSGGSWSSVATLDTDSIATMGVIAQWSLFTDGTTLFALYGVNAATDGWRLQWSTNTTSWNNVTTTVLPDALVSTADGGTFAGVITTEVFQPVYNVTNGILEIYLYHATTGVFGTSRSMYQWIDVSTEMVLRDFGGDVAHAIPSGFPNFGERIFIPGQLFPALTGHESTFGGEKWTFEVYGGGTGHIVDAFYTEAGEPVLVEATLKEPVTGGSAALNTSLNQIENVDGNATEYTVLWDFAADGIGSDEFVHRVLRVTRA